MPTYQATFRAENITSIRNVYAPTVIECIDKVIENEIADWVGMIEYINLVRLEDK